MHSLNIFDLAIKCSQEEINMYSVRPRRLERDDLRQQMKMQIATSHPITIIHKKILRDMLLDSFN